ncbi:acyl-CoA dehydrogenase family protein [Temperatibacter marinus]|uniref:Acyl-CoA dehydrogenase family protein n=1 Tax=Temperatibacter marinus TaxID=1456591 RepID=A0AA52EEB0_9PROT|nr:acyl-CoA dehydrogenase family protein [Temperatibacter marinus]WND01503.1 acyl-CoA dehydrogenase family protein [Temperatibacter marinus]
MDFNLNEDQRAIQDMARQFAEDVFYPNAAEWDEKKLWPSDVVKQAGELGFGSIYVSEEMGGCALSRVESALIFEQLSKGCPSTAAMISIHNMATYMIDSFGNETVRKKYVPALSTLETLASYCLTEPGAGSDAASIKTKAERDGDDYILNGTKAFISGGGVSDVYVVMAKTSDQGAAGISCFVVEKDTPGLSFGAQEKKMGWRSQPTSMVMFDECRIPAENLVGDEGQGFKIAMQGLDGGRLNIAACSIGGAQRALDEAIVYTKERKQFGKTIAAFQATQFKLADMQTDLEAARLMLYSAAQKVSNNTSDATASAAMAKRFATDVGFDIVNDALQLHGGYGYIQEYPIERILRDLRVHQILEGTNEIMRVIIGRDLLKD